MIGTEMAETESDILWSMVDYESLSDAKKYILNQCSAALPVYERIP